jgi:GNAT superfamily N-acetyltransferase
VKPVMQNQRWNIHLVPGFDFAAISLPADENINEGIWNIDAESMGVPAANGHLHFRVTAADDGEWVARAAFGAGDRSVQCCMIEVREDFQRRGIATAMYRWASCLFDAPVTPSSQREPAALQFWKGRTEITC